METVEITIKEETFFSVNGCGGMPATVWKIFFNGVFQTLSASRMEAEIFKAKAEKLLSDASRNKDIETTIEYKRIFK